MKSIRLLFLLLASFTVVLAGCAAGPSDQTPQNHAAHSEHQQYAPNGDLQETTASIKQLPTFLDKVDLRIKDIYRVAGDHLDVLQWIPCYCGCAESANHLNNANCFVKEVKADGSVVWDDHGTRCGTCMEIAATSVQMKMEGKSTKEIRNYIDDHYKSGYAAPTPTPMPE